MEKQLYEDFLELRRKVIKAKGWWFRQAAKRILNKMDPENIFKFSNRWFQAFKARHKISLRQPTHTSQKETERLQSLMQGFHRDLRRISTIKKEEFSNQEGLHRSVEGF